MIAEPDALAGQIATLGGYFIGTVVDNADPDKHRRIKVTIPDIYVGTTIQLPWVFAKPDAGLGGGLLHSGFAVPLIGSTVIVEFPFNDPYLGFYTGRLDVATSHPAGFDTSYPYEYGFRDPMGNIIKGNASTGDLKVTTMAGLVVKIAGAGKVIQIGSGTELATCGVVTKECTCSYTGGPHPEASAVLLVKKLAT